VHSSIQEQDGRQPEVVVEVNNEGRTSRVDELAERLKAANADPTVAALILDNWQRTVGTIAIVVLGFWLYNEYQARQTEQVGELSHRFDEARRSLVTLTIEKEVTKPDPAKPEVEEKAKADLASALKGDDDAFDLLKTTGSGTAYSTFAETYRALSSAYQGNTEEALEKLKSFKPEQYFSAAEPTPSQQVHGINVTQEAAALLAARIQAAKDVELARKQLSGLALSAQFVNSEALLSLFRLAQTAEQRAAAEAVAHRVIQARPEQLDQIQSDLGQFGFKP
jgi:hypothetical protein